MIKKISLLLLLVWSQTAYCQLTASFYSSDSVGCNSLIVQFTNASSGGSNLSYKWDFGNGTTSTLTNPQIVYNTVGSYTVVLIVYDQNLSDTIEKQNHIIINKPPVITSISAAPQKGCIPFETTLSATIENGSAPISTMTWDLGNGESSSLIQPKPIYTTQGKFTPSLFVVDTNNCEANYSVAQLVSAVANPSINFKANKNVACVDTLTVNFQNLSSGSSALTYLWDFGNGNNSNELSPTQFYSGFNNYTVKLIGIDNSGCKDSLVKTNFVSMQDLSANVTLSDSYLCKHEGLNISNDTQGANRYYWNFDDNTSSTLRTPLKSFTDTGSFEILYIASLDNNCSDTIILSVYVDPVTANFSSDKNYGCEFPLSVQYNNFSINADNWYWSFGDSTQSNLENPVAEYSISKELELNHNVYLNDTLIAESSMNCRDTFTITNNVHLYYPKVYFTPNDSSIYKPLTEGCLPIAVNFTNQSDNYNDDDPFVDLQWDFGDGSSSTSENPVHDYTNSGEFLTTLSVTNQSGCVNIYTTKIKTGFKQNAKFSYSGSPDICGSELVALKNESIDSLLIDAWEWTFSEGTVVDGANPVVQFVDTGFISGELSVSYNGCKSEPFVIDSFVYINGPAGNYKLSLNCDEPFKYYFQSNVNGADSWYYGFGNNLFDSTQASIVEHQYTERGDYKSFLEAENSETGCSLVVNNNVYVRDLEAQFDFLPNYNCSGDSIFFDPSATIDNYWILQDKNLGKYFWDFGDGSDQELGLGIQNHIYEESQTYNVTLSVSDINGCEQDLTKQVKVYGIDANFTYSDSIGCAPISVDFIDTSTADTTLGKWLWNFGNNITDTNQNNTHTFNQDASYTVTLQVTDVVGCSNTIKKQNVIYSSNPVPLFQADKTNICFNDSIKFKNLSTGNAFMNFHWDFGNGATSKLFEPSITYSDTGLFNVSLLVIDSLGCDSQLIKPNYVYIQTKPNVNFSSDAISSSCYPKGIGFTDETISNDISKMYWDFGDSETVENISNPYHTYLIPGKYDIKLKVVTSLGCIDSLIKDGLINIGGPYAEIIAPDTSCINIPIPIGFDTPININDFQWTLEDGAIFNTPEFNKIYDSFGIKKLYLHLESDTLGTCDKIISDSINIPILVASFNIEDTTECIPFFSLASNISTNASYFEWYINNNLFSSLANPEINVNESGNSAIKLVAINTVGCRDSIFQNISVYPLPEIELNNDTLICQYDSIWLNASGGIQYLWYNNGDLIENEFANIVVSPLINEQYNLTVIDENNCINHDSVLINVQSKPTALVINSDTTLIIGESIELNAIYTDADIIEWTPGDYLNCSNCETAVSIPFESTNYIFTVSDNNNCFFVSDSVYIIVDAKYSVDVPTSFSPNGDGINDMVFVLGWGIKELTLFEIYDVAGRLVFQTNDITEGWDGNSHLGKQQPGMYIYTVNVLSYDNENRVKQGYIYLIK